MGCRQKGHSGRASPHMGCSNWCGMSKKTIIHVNQRVIKNNLKTGSKDPVLTVKTYNSNDYGHEAVIRDNQGNEVARVIYSPSKPLSCGARVWIEVKGENGSVEVIKEPQLLSDRPEVCQTTPCLT